jgi:hypothetical protein
MNKEFSVMRWIIFPAISITLASVVAYFNLDIFGKDGIAYAAIVLLIAGFSIVIVKYTESQNRLLVIASFVCEIVLTVVLIANASYSLSVQRKMSVAKQSEKVQVENLEKISKLRGARTQREAVEKMGEFKTAQQTFENYETVLFWIMISELSLFGICAFTLFGIAKLSQFNSKTNKSVSSIIPDISFEANHNLSQCEPKEQRLN